MDKREEAFWDYYNPIQELADKHDVSIYTIRNFREIFDYAYAAGKTEGLETAMTIFNNNFNKESN
jgi:hypothetical protein